MAEGKAKAKRVSLPRIDTSSTWLRSERSRIQPLGDRLLSAVASTLSMSPDRLKLDDCFADLGGDPRTAMALRKTCMGDGMEVKTRDIMASRTLAELETHIIPCTRQSAPGLVPISSPDAVMITPEKIHEASRLGSPKAVDRLRAMESLDASLHLHSRTASTSTSATTSEKTCAVEMFLGSDKAVAKVVVLKPRAGLFDDKLVACLTLSSIPAREPESPNIELVTPTKMFFAGTQVATLKRSLEMAEEVQAPDVWIVLDSMPMLGWGEMDRRRLRTWIQNANEQLYERVMSLGTHHTLEQPTSEMDKSLQKLVARTLSVPPDQVGMNFTFQQLGGDEMASMALVSRCRVESILLESHEILQHSTLAQLALIASQRGGAAHRWEEEGSAFSHLSPMQNLYFHTKMGGETRTRSSTDGGYRFNQSLLLRVSDGFALDDISASLDAVVGHHSMLRARFTTIAGEWTQQILPEVDGSYSFTHYTISTDEHLESVINQTQASIDVEEGPLFAVAHFSTNTGHQMIYLVAHHLVVDVVSWRVLIQDLDELMQTGSLLSKRSMPFHKFTELQRLDARLPSAGLPFDLCPGDLGYWGLLDASNTYGDAHEASFSLGAELTSILETTCNKALRTDSSDIYLSALLLSFAQTFTDRRVPNVWNQEHGRDQWSSDVDISETVGWFTTLCPLSQDVQPTSDFLDVLRRLKDTRRAIPHRGSRYFASKLIDGTGNNTAARPGSPAFLQLATREWPIEILFSYAGSLQNLAKDPVNGHGVLEQMSIPGRTLASRTSDIGPAVGRIALFEVSAMVDQGSAKIKFLYNRNSLHRDRIDAWINNYEHLLFEAIGRLRFAETEMTLSDVPQLIPDEVTYEGLAKLKRVVLGDLNLSSVSDIEAVYPATLAQQSILVSQVTSNGNGSSDACHIHSLYEFASPNGRPVDLGRICAAWEQVVSRYPALRTVFIDGIAERGLYNAVVLRRVSPNMLFIDATPAEDPVETLNALPPLTSGPALKNVPRHRLTVCHSPMKTVVKLDVSAALCDMMSVNALIVDLRRGYATGRALPDGPVFSYAGYLDITRSFDREKSIAYWKETLARTQPCLFPRLDFCYGGKSQAGARRFDNVHVELDITAHKMAEFSRANKTTTGAILRLAWGLVLRAVTNSSSVCFGYRAPGRSASLEGMRSAVGCFSNIIACNFDLSPFKPVSILLRQIEDQYVGALPHQHITTAEVRHALGAELEGAGDKNSRLFNSCISFTEEAPVDLNSKFTTRTSFELRNLLNRETSDYDLAINARFTGSNATGGPVSRLVVDVGHSILSETQACHIANMFGRAIDAILKSSKGNGHASSLVGSIDLFSDRDYSQIVSWASEKDVSSVAQRTLLHELVFAQSIRRPESRAVCAHDGDLSYLQMEALAHRLAHVLADAGVGRGADGKKTAVPVILGKSKWSPIALLAVLKAGAACVPIDCEEMGFVAKIAGQLGEDGAGVVLASGSVAESLEKCEPRIFDKVIALNDGLMKRLETEAPAPGRLIPPSKPEDVACVFFTPTSSRDVRGICFTHAALSTAFLAQGPAVGISPMSRVLQLSSFNVDIALAEVFTTLVSGGTICIPTSRERYADYTGVVSRYGVSWSYMTPLLARKLNVDMLPSLKTVVFRTRGLDEDTYAPWKGKKRIIMAYGAPDTCPLGISFLEVHGPHHLRAVGRPIAGSAWIVNPEDHRNLMPVGAVGELVVEGPTLGRTYRKNLSLKDDYQPNHSHTIDAVMQTQTPSTPDCKSPASATAASPYPAASSITSPTSQVEVHGQTRKRYYKTGHSMRYIEGGLMEHVSPKRGNLEINGRTVNLGELEQNIRRALGAGVDAMVEAYTFKGERASPTLAAFLELGGRAFDGATGTASSDLLNLSPDLKERVYLARQLIEKALRNTVPSCMVPQIYIPVRHLPITHSLKVNRRKLQKAIRGLSREQLVDLAAVEDPVSPRSCMGLKPLPPSATEERMRAIWAGVLGVEEAGIGPEEGFMALGGDEISAVEVVVACRREGLGPSIADVVRDASLTEICRGLTMLKEAVSPAVGVSAAHESVTSGSTPGVSPFPSTLQRRPAHGNSPSFISKKFIETTIAPKLGLGPSSIKEVAEATSTQIRYIESGMQTGLAHVNYFVFNFTAASSASAVQAARLEEVCQILASIHPILRTAFVPHVEGLSRKVYQVVLKNHTVEFKHISCQGWRLGATADKEIKKDRHASRCGTQQLVFTQPVTRFFFLDAGKQSTLIMRLSKAQYDDLSIALLVKDLKKLYDSSGGQNPPRRPGHADFVRAASIANAGVSGADAEVYWRSLLEGAAITQVVNHTKPPGPSVNVTTLRETFTPPPAGGGGLADVLASLGVSGFDTVLKAAWAMVLATVSATPDVVFGEVVEGCHGRLPGAARLGGVLGPTTNTVPVRVRFGERPSHPRDLLRRVQTQRDAGRPFENLGALDVVERCTPWPYWSRLSSVVQHQSGAAALVVAPGDAPRTFRLGGARCRFTVRESEAVDVPDLWVRSVLRTVEGGGSNDDDGGFAGKKDDQAVVVELKLTFSEDRVPVGFAQEVLRTLCSFVNLLLTAGSAAGGEQAVVPSAGQYAGMARQIPLPQQVPAAVKTIATPSASAKPETRMTTEQTHAVQGLIEGAWRSALDPRALGVPEEHVASAAFYDLWGSLVPARQMAEHLTGGLPAVAAGLPAGLDAARLRVDVEDVIAHPTMLRQFELISRRVFGDGGPASPAGGGGGSGGRGGMGHGHGRSGSVASVVSSSSSSSGESPVLGGSAEPFGAGPVTGFAAARRKSGAAAALGKGLRRVATLALRPGTLDGASLAAGIHHKDSTASKTFASPPPSMMLSPPTSLPALTPDGGSTASGEVSPFVRLSSAEAPQLPMLPPFTPVSAAFGGAGSSSPGHRGSSFAVSFSSSSVGSSSPAERGGGDEEGAAAGGAEAGNAAAHHSHSRSGSDNSGSGSGSSSSAASMTDGSSGDELERDRDDDEGRHPPLAQLHSLPGDYDDVVVAAGPPKAQQQQQQQQPQVVVRARDHVGDDGQQLGESRDESYDSPQATPRQRPVTVIRSPLGDAAAAAGGGGGWGGEAEMLRLMRDLEGGSRVGVVDGDVEGLEGGDIDDIVSPLTPDKGARSIFGGRGGGKRGFAGAGAGVSGSGGGGGEGEGEGEGDREKGAKRVVSTVSPVTPSGSFPLNYYEL